MEATKQILEAVENATRTGFWGQIQIDFQHGEPTLLRVTKTQKLYDERSNHRDYDYRSK